MRRGIGSVDGLRGLSCLLLAVFLAESGETAAPAEAACVTPAAAAAATPTDAFATTPTDIVDRFAARPDEPVRSFRARRRLDVSGAFGKHAWMEALVELDPARGFRYNVLAAGGSKSLQRKILERILESEREVYARGANDATALTAENYALAFDGRDERGLVRLRAVARRKEDGLLDGHFLVTPDAADLVEVSGRLVKAPAFWVPRVEMRKCYARIRGHRVNVRVESVAHVRLLGKSRFTMTSEYDAIEGEALTCEDDASSYKGDASSHEGDAF